MRPPRPRYRCRGALLVLFAGAASCQCADGKFTSAAGELRFEPAGLDFGKVAVGAAVVLPLELINSGRAPETAALVLEGPFALAEATVEVPGGTSMAFAVTFAPEAVGAVAGSLALADGGSASLWGEGIAACVASNPCVAAAFDEASRACVEAPLADGSPCAAACVVDGECRQGQCLGQFATCDDGDRCTLDSCDSSGACRHDALECPVSDPCQVGVCVPATGCGSAQVPDGTPCGGDTCELAHICLAGACALRQKPNAAAECRYTQVAASMGFACGLTVSGRARCWGQSEFNSYPPAPSAVTSLGLSYAFGSVPPTVVPRLSANVQAIGASTGFVCGAVGGAVTCTGIGGGPDAGLGAGAGASAGDGAGGGRG